MRITTKQAKRFETEHEVINAGEMKTTDFLRIYKRMKYLFHTEGQNGLQIIYYELEDKYYKI